MVLTQNQPIPAVSSAQPLRIIGLISGTSADGIDAALVELSGQGYSLSCQFKAGGVWPYSPLLKSQILAVAAGQPLSMEALAALDGAIAAAFAKAAQALQADAGPVDLIASHGQTVFHQPPQAGELGYSLQLGRGELIAALTDLPVVSNFRQADLAAGGHGAPLVPPVDACLLRHPNHSRCVQNIGGIGNVAFLPAGRPDPNYLPPILGWDTGPGNSLIDIAVQRFSGGQLSYDQDGAWAAQGQPCRRLVQQWLNHPFFQMPPPKSTGRELFGWAYLERCCQEAEAEGLSQADVLATLTDFTAASIADSYRRFLPAQPAEVLLCGGGSRNQYLRQRLQFHLGPVPLATTDAAGVPADYKEAIAFAVLGFWRWHNICGNLPAVTGACMAKPLGEIHQPLYDQA